MLNSLWSKWSHGRVRRRLAANLAVFLSLLVVGVNGAHAQPIKVAVASNFLSTAELLKEYFSATTQIEVELIAASTGKLYAQIVNGAPYDVFMAADTAHPLQLIEAGVAKSKRVHVFAVGQLMLWTRDGLALEDIWQTKPTRVAIANPKLAPFGAAARSVMIDRQVWEAWAETTVQGENINQTLQFALSGSVDLAFLSMSQASALTNVGVVYPLTLANAKVLHQAAVALSDSPTGQLFVNFLSTDEARLIIAEQGYELP